MIWTCQWCGHPAVVPEFNPVVYVCDECGRQAGGVFDVMPPVRDLTEEERELVELQVTWAGVLPDMGTVRALRLFDRNLGDEPLAAVVDILRRNGYHSLGIHQRIEARRIVEDPGLRGLHIAVKRVG